MRHPAVAGGREPVALGDALRALEPERMLVFCDEDAPRPTRSRARGALKSGRAAVAAAALAVLIGPEGGFAEEERACCCSGRNLVRLALGPRILRADTAAVAALALVQAVLGDWRDGS